MLWPRPTRKALPVPPTSAIGGNASSLGFLLANRLMPASIATEAALIKHSSTRASRESVSREKIDAGCKEMQKENTLEVMIDGSENPICFSLRPLLSLSCLLSFIVVAQRRHRLDLALSL